MMRVRLIDNGERLWFKCPGCGENHGIRIAGEGVSHPCWEWNGRFDSPTLSPSVLSSGFKFASTTDDTQVPYTCHSFVRDGMIQFLSDCTHALAGQTIPLPDISPEVSR